MGFVADMILSSAKRSRAYAERLLKDVAPAQFARKPCPGGVTIDTNHPAFVYGHLVLYPHRIMTIAGQDGSAIAPPGGWEDLFKAGVPCQDDPEGTIYPSMEQITAHFFRATDAALNAVAALPDDAFGAVNPEARSREFLPTVGNAALFLLNNHVMMHLGQVSAWRRCIGLGAV